MLRWSRWRDGRWALERVCSFCLRSRGWAKQTPEALAAAPPRPGREVLVLEDPDPRQLLTLAVTLFARQDRELVQRWLSEQIERFHAEGSGS
jgi:hypothetical protein